MYFVYVLTNSKKNVLYIGVTNDIVKRLCQHYDERGNRKTFAGRYSCFNLIYFEQHVNIYAAISREKQIKGWVRKKKIELIKASNPDLVFLNSELLGAWPPY